MTDDVTDRSMTAEITKAVTIACQTCWYVYMSYYLFFKPRGLAFLKYAAKQRLLTPVLALPTILAVAASPRALPPRRQNSANASTATALAVAALAVAALAVGMSPRALPVLRRISRR
jgi:hypothetical protein